MNLYVLSLLSIWSKRKNILSYKHEHKNRNIIFINNYSNINLEPRT